MFLSFVDGVQFVEAGRCGFGDIPRPASLAIARRRLFNRVSRRTGIVRELGGLINNRADITAYLQIYWDESYI